MGGSMGSPYNARWVSMACSTGAVAAALQQTAIDVMLGALHGIWGLRAVLYRLRPLLLQQYVSRWLVRYCVRKAGLALPG